LHLYAMKDSHLMYSIIPLSGCAEWVNPIQTRWWCGKMAEWFAMSRCNVSAAYPIRLPSSR